MPLADPLNADPLNADPLNAEAIRAGLAAHDEELNVEVCERCTSTNTELLQRGDTEIPALLVTEEQTAGRGRRGRRWYADPGSALMFSLRWQFAGPPARLRGLSLATGVGIAHALRAIGAQNLTLKWPNDLLSGNAKLGGMLIETRTTAGRIAAVIGIGINCRRQPGLGRRLKRSIAALEELIDPLPARNAMLARLAAELVRTMRMFDARGLAAFRSEWESMHAQQGKPMRVRIADGRVIAGVAEGIAEDGALLLRNRLGVRSITSGTVLHSDAQHTRAA